MNHALRTIGYFVTWGTFYGFMLGMWSGTAIFPAYGTILATGWGTGLGAACGLLCGLLVALIQADSFHPEVDIGAYRRRLSLGIGLFTPMAAALILIVTSRDTIGPKTWITNYSNVPFLLLSVIAVTLWGGLSAAYVANAYPEWLAHLKTGQKSPILSWPSFSSPVPRLMMTLYRRALNWGTLLLGVIAGIYAHMRIALMYPPHPITAGYVLLKGGEGVVLGFAASAIIVLLICFGNAALLTFLKRAVFAEDVLSVSPRKLRWTLTIIAFVFTGITSVWTLIFAPLCALLMALYVYDAFPLLDEDFEKAKRKEKNALALADENQADDAGLLMDDATLIEAQQQ